MKDHFLKIRLSDKEYTDFKKVCGVKNKSMSEVVRSFVDTYIESKNIILLDIDNKTLSDTSKLCKEKKIKFDKLIKYLLGKAIKNKDKLNLSR